MDATEIVGKTAFIFTVIFASAGIMAQIIKNYKVKSTSGLSMITMGMQFLCFVLWSLYGYLKDDFNLIGANVPGCFFVGVILFQFLLYKKAPEEQI